MEVITRALCLLAAYLIGSIPFGLIIVRLITGKDIRSVESGRTGGTNAMRAAGFWAGLLTVLLDVSKGFFAVKISHLLIPGPHVWLEVLSPLLAIIGHNYSIFLIRRDENGWLKFHGGAGGAPCFGGSLGLWFPSLFVIGPISALIYYFGGYASITTLSVAVLSTILFSIRALNGLNPWEYTVYGILSFLVLAWALRPNIKRLFNGTERVVGLRAKRHSVKE